MGRFLNWKFQIYLFNGVLTHNLTLKAQQNSSKAHFSDQNLTFSTFSSTVLSNDGYIFLPGCFNIIIQQANDHNLL